nr:MAG TPA: hypothetical protein [Caudoviricetes sp.]
MLTDSEKQLLNIVRINGQKRREFNKRKRPLDYIVDILKGEYHVSSLPILRRCSDCSIFTSAIRDIRKPKIGIFSRLLGRMPEM